MVEILANIVKEINKLPKPEFNIRVTPSGINGVKFTAVYCEKFLDELPDKNHDGDSQKREKARLLMMNGTVDFDEMMNKSKR